MVEKKETKKVCPKCDTDKQKEQEASKPYMFSRK
jgi:hypothetical protein